jgi:hypothetical protein
MINKMFSCVIILSACLFVSSFAQQFPLVYDVENTAATYPKPTMPTVNELPPISNLPDPFMWADGRGRISNFSDWRYRRAEIKAMIENYEIGEKPIRPDSITASYAGGVLTVNVVMNGKTLTLTSQVTVPTGTGPFPAVIGMDFIPAGIFNSSQIAQITFHSSQVTTYGGPKSSDPYYQLYPDLDPSNTGQYSTWSWGVSRIIDGLELIKKDLPIDTRHLAVIGCSYAGKMAIFAGAFDERIALTIGLESGGGGYTTWRVSETLGSVETLEATDYNWFEDAMKNFFGKVSRLPEDHHELMAMVAPRALFVTGNPGYVWLADESGYVGSKAAKEVWKALGVPDRFGFSQIGGHNHCAIPDAQIPEIESFVDKFLLGKDTVNTTVATTPYTTDLSPWITWSTPTLVNGNSLINYTTLSSPSDHQTGMDTSVTFRWSKVQSAVKYNIQLSLISGFTNPDKIDTSITDTVITFSGLKKSKTYYWRVKVQSTAGVDLWSDTRLFITTTSKPAPPQLVSAVPTYVNRGDVYTLTWNKVKDAEQYLVYLSKVPTFASSLRTATPTDTVVTFTALTKATQYYWKIQASNFVGAGPWSDSWTFNTTVTEVQDEPGIPSEYSMSQNYPNPFNPTTTIKFSLPQSDVTTLTIYDLLGKEVQTLIHKELAAGYHEINFDGGTLGNGVYFYRIQAGNFRATKKLLLLK